MAYYGYIRVSTKGQVPGTSLAEQEHLITCAKPYRRGILWWSAKWIGFAGLQRKACSM